MKKINLFVLGLFAFVLPDTGRAFSMDDHADMLGTNGVDIIADGSAPSVPYGTAFPSNVPVGLAVTRSFTLRDTMGPGWFFCIATQQMAETGGVASNFSIAWSPDDCVNPNSYTTLRVTYQPKSGGSQGARLFLVDDFHNPPPGYTYAMNFTGHCSGVVQVMDKQPANAARAAAGGTDLQATFSDVIKGSTLTTNRFIAWGRQSGLHRGAIAWNAASNQATLNPAADFRPGESVFAEIAQGVTNATALANARPCAWSFQAAASNATIGFLGGGQRLGTNDARGVAVTAHN